MDKHRDMCPHVTYPLLGMRKSAHLSHYGSLSGGLAPGADFRKKARHFDGQLQLPLVMVD